jgi:hypothetical protein
MEKIQLKPIKSSAKKDLQNVNLIQTLLFHLSKYLYLEASFSSFRGTIIKLSFP